MVRWHGQRGGNMKRWQFGKGRRVVRREGGMELNFQIKDLPTFFKGPFENSG